jgi:hypothetical protein
MSAGQEQLRTALKVAASTLSAAKIPFALAGSYALWAFGAPEPEHDVDLVVPEESTEDAAATLSGAGFDVARPPEGWLFKATLDGATVDVLHGECGETVTVDTLADAQERQLFGVWLPVLPPGHVIRVKLRTMSEHYCDFGALLPPVRAVREQLNWDRLVDQTADNDFAAAFLYLVERLGIGDPRLVGAVERTQVPTRP